MNSRFRLAIEMGLSIFPILAQSPRVELLDGGRIPSLLRILASPDSFHGKEIQVIGFLDLAFEGTALYLHREDLAYGVLGNSIWVNVSSEMHKRAKVLNRKYVIIRGTFDANNHGHMGLFSGALTNITRCDVWADPKHPRWGEPPPPPPNPRDRVTPK